MEPYFIASGDTLPNLGIMIDKNMTEKEIHRLESLCRLLQNHSFKKALDKTLIQHGINHLDEAGDVGTVDVVSWCSVLFSCVHTCFVDADHNLM